MKGQALTCEVIRPGDTYRGKQDLEYFAGISAQSAGSTSIMRRPSTCCRARPACGMATG